MKLGNSTKNTEPYQRYCVADLVVDLGSRTVTRAGEILDVRDLTFDLLAFLITKAPMTVTRDEFAEQVWRVSHLSEETIVQRVAILRRALGKSAKSPKYIRTVRGVGYAMACDVQPVPRSKLRSFSPRARVIMAGGVLGFAAAAAMTLAIGANKPPVIDQSTEPVAETTVASLQLARAQDLLALHQPLETDQAIDLLESAVSESPKIFELRLALSFAYSTRATKFKPDEADIIQAETLARALVAEDIKSARAWHALAYALDAQGRVDEAISSYQHAYSLDPMDAAAMSSAAYLFQIRGRYNEALDLEARALQVSDPTLYAPLQIATTLSMINHPASDDWWHRALASNPHQSVVLIEAMQEDLRRADPNGALARLQSAPEAIRQTPRALRLSGRAHLKLGHVEAAQVAFERAGERARFDTASLARQRDANADVAGLIQAAETMMINGELI
ncbi:MAG: winged helix-turn-helix domain-containing protein, partial [Pseudomonadota bacterium]